MLVVSLIFCNKAKARFICCMGIKKLVVYLVGIICCWQLTACSSINKTKKAPTYEKRLKKANAKTKFIDHLEVTPGNVVVTKHKPITTHQKKIIISKPKYDSLIVSSESLEQADDLQIIYAIKLDVNVEDLKDIKLLQLINEWWGTPYCMGGQTKGCIDCSSFTQNIFRDAWAIDLPRTAQEQYNISQRINFDELQTGDLVFFHSGRKAVTHVGMYLCNNKFVHASTGSGVMISDLGETYWRQKWKAAGRINSTSTEN